MLKLLDFEDFVSPSADDYGIIMGLETESLGEIPSVNDDLLVAHLAAAALTPDRDDRGRQELLGGRDGW